MTTNNERLITFYTLQNIRYQDEIKNLQNKIYDTQTEIKNREDKIKENQSIIDQSIIDQFKN